MEEKKKKKIKVVSHFYPGDEPLNELKKKLDNSETKFKEFATSLNGSPAIRIEYEKEKDTISK